MNTLFGYVGIDAAKAFHVVCVKDMTKHSLIPSITVDDDEAGYEKLRHCFDQLKDKHGITLFAVGIEATGTYHLKLVEYLRSQPDTTVTVLNPLQTAHYLKSDLRRASTDKVSADIIAQYMAEKTPAPTALLPAQYQTANHLAKRLHALTKHKSATINRLREHLSLIWPEIERTQPNFNTKQLLALLTVAQCPEQVKTLDFVASKKISVLGSAYTLRSDFITTIQTLAQTSQRRFAPAATEPIIKSLAEEILFVLHQIDQLTDALRQLFVQHNTSDEQPLLVSIDGVGEMTAMVVTAAIGDVNRFSSSKQIVAYFGLNPRVKQSGTSVHGRGYIQKKGNSLVRYYLFNCVLAMTRKANHPIAKFYRRLCEKGKPKMVALIACMKKLVTIMFAMLKSNTKFSITYAA